MLNVIDLNGLELLDVILPNSAVLCYNCLELLDVI